MSERADTSHAPCAVQLLAKANRERLAVLLAESRGGGTAGDERYAASLRQVP